MGARDYCVYWLYDDTCTQPSESGYIGCCSRLDVRLRAHRQGHGTHKGAVNVPADFKVAVLFVGPENECLAHENLFRPGPNIGWNIRPGGLPSARGTKHTAEFKRWHAEAASKRFKGVRKSPEQKANMSAAAFARYADPAEHEKTSRALIGKIDNRGKRNPMFGRHMSEATKEKIRAKILERGGVSGKNNPRYRHGRYVRGDPSKG
jgi:hypothetical protein